MNRDIVAQDAESVCADAAVNALSGARVLVTGASGLLGTYFLACLAAMKEGGQRLEVYAHTFSPPPAHVLEIVRRGGFTVVKGDLAEFTDYAALPEADVIVHAAGYAQPGRFMAIPGSTLQVNAAATLALLKRLARGGHFLFLSSAHVYLGLRGTPCREEVVGTTTPAHPRASYIEGKRAGEAACHAFRSVGVHATAVRLGDVYGPGTRPHDQRALNSFVEKALVTGEIRMLDAGGAVRSFCYVADAVGVMMRIMAAGKEAVYNVGGHGVTTIGEVARTIGRLTGAVVIPGPPGTGVTGAPDALLLDLSRVDAEFGVFERTGLEQGLSATIDWQRDLYGGAARA